MLAIFKEKLIGLLLKSLPAFLGRMLVNIKQMEQDFEIDRSSTAPPTICLNAFVPYLDFYLRITNKSALPITVDRILFEIWIGQSTIESALLRRIAVTPKETNNNVYFRQLLGQSQVNAIKGQLTEKGQLKPSLTIHATALCDCKIGSFCVKKTFNVEGPSVPVN
jgi:hypothetical protein